jgi:hypothetical protein
MERVQAAPARVWWNPPAPEVPDAAIGGRAEVGFERLYVNHNCGADLVDGDWSLHVSAFFYLLEGLVKTFVASLAWLVTFLISTDQHDKFRDVLDSQALSIKLSGLAIWSPAAAKAAVDGGYVDEHGHNIPLIGSYGGANWRWGTPYQVATTGFFSKLSFY